MNFDELKTLNLVDRIKELKNIIEALKEKLTKAKETEKNQLQEQLRQAEHQLTLADEEIRQQELTQEITQVRKEKLEEKIQQPQQETQLEQLLRATPTPETIHRLAHQPIETLYAQIKKTQDNQYESKNYFKHEVYMLDRALEEKRRDIEKGDYKPETRAKHLMDKTEQMLETAYHGTTKQYHSNPN